jgi:amino acid transporter
VFSGSPAIGLMFAASAFIGFEATVIYRREARDPDRTIPRATYLAVSGVGIFYVISSWMLVMAWGPSQAVEVAAQDPGSMLVATAARYLGVFGELATVVLLITSLFAAVLSFHNVLNRYQRSMAQAGVLPAYLAQSHLRTDAPRRAAVVQTVASVALVLLFALLGLDPVVQVFAWLPAIATIAIMTLMAAVSLSVLLFFRNRHPDLGSWRRVIAPALSVISLLAIVVIVLINLPLLAGEIGADGNPAYGPVSVTLVGIVVLVGLAGVIRALIMRRTSPNAYEALVDTLHE